MFDPPGDDSFGRHVPDKLLLPVDLGHLGGEIGGVVLRELLRDAVDTRGLEQVAVLAARALDAEQIGVVDPLESQLCRDPRLLGKLVATFGEAPESGNCSVVVMPAAVCFSAYAGPTRSISSILAMSLRHLFRALRLGPSRHEVVNSPRRLGVNPRPHGWPRSPLDGSAIVAGVVRRDSRPTGNDSNVCARGARAPRRARTPEARRCA
jgi:hypothetical protein